MKNTTTLDLMSFQFRNIHPKILIGTASDRYAGWIGQIYTKERYHGRIARRKNTVGGKSFIEDVLPVDSVKEYFEHFPVLEIDYTFYRPLLDTEGKPTPNYNVLRRYQTYMKEKDCIIIKVPQMITAQKLLRGSTYRKNETYLNADVFTRQFYEPAVDVLGPALTGFLFEQGHQRKQDRTPVAHMAQQLDAFFEAIPSDTRYHIELRTESYLNTPVFEVLEKHGVGQVLSQWTWLPPLRKQFTKANRILFNAGRNCIVRLMTPIGMRYEAAYEKAHPFDRLVEGMLRHEMVEETLFMMKTAREEGGHDELNHQQQGRRKCSADCSSHCRAIYHVLWYSLRKENVFECFIETLQLMKHRNNLFWISPLRVICINESSPYYPFFVHDKRCRNWKFP